MVMAHTNKINTSNTVKYSAFAQFEQSLYCALSNYSKQSSDAEAQKTQIDWRYHEKLLDENSDIHDFCCDWSGFGRML